MVKVLENSMVDLDFVPGKDEQQLQAQARQQAQAMGGQAGYDFLRCCPRNAIANLRLTVVDAATKPKKP